MNVDRLGEDYPSCYALQLGWHLWTQDQSLGEEVTTIQKDVLSAPTKPKNNTKNHLQQNTNSQY